MFTGWHQHSYPILAKKDKFLSAVLIKHLSGISKHSAIVYRHCSL